MIENLMISLISTAICYAWTYTKPLLRASRALIGMGIQHDKMHQIQDVHMLIKLLLFQALKVACMQGILWFALWT